MVMCIFNSLSIYNECINNIYYLLYFYNLLKLLYFYIIIKCKLVIINNFTIPSSNPNFNSSF